MAYAAVSDVERAVGGSANLVALADTDGNATTDAGVVEAAIAEADAEINTYASKRFSPAALASLSAPALTALSARIAGRVLKRNRSMLGPAEVEQAKLDQKWLEDLAAGKVLPGTEAAPTASSIVNDEVGERESTKAISREKLKGALW